jgi:uncharacterized protein
MTVLIFYHMMSKTTPCPDGIFSDAVAHRRFGNDAKYIGCCYVKAGERPPEADLPQPNDFVFMLDFSLEPWILEEWRNKGVRFKIIDHHEKKMRELLGKRELADFIKFDNDKCGAILTWEYFFKEIPVPAILYYIDDRDRWKHKLPFTKEIHAAVSAIGRNFDVFEMLLPLSQQQLINIFDKLGKRELEARAKKIEELASSYKYDYLPTTSFHIPIVELQPNESWAGSEVCELLYNKFPDAPFTACWYKDNDGQKWSLRSNAYGNNFDVETIARHFGGGGHRNAAGMTIKGEPQEIKGE